MPKLNETSNANRIHIGIFGRTNSGKSSLINAFAHQNISIVSDIKGTTTDPVYKAMEIYPIGPCTIIDTAGFDDNTELGSLRENKTKAVAEKTDIAVIVISATDIIDETSFEEEIKWTNYFKEKCTPVLVVINKIDTLDCTYERIKTIIDSTFQTEKIYISAVTGEGINAVVPMLTRLLPEGHGDNSITGGLCQKGDLVLLVMPQDIQAPKGRLILPQVQTIRELLDKKCHVVCSTTDEMVDTIKDLSKAPDLIITDSQVFKYVFDNKPEGSLLTSFSVLMAAYKGDIDYYVESANAIDKLTEESKVLIAECCTHAPLDEDIGRVKIPGLLRKKVGNNLKIDIVSGADFPENLKEYDLIIQCGACMFNRKHVLSRIDRAKHQNVPMTNYGITIAYLTGIIDNVVYP